MKYKIMQNKKTLFQAFFQVESEGDICAELQLKGRLGSKEGVWSGTIFGNRVWLERKGGIVNGSDGKFRPYCVYFNEIEVGEIYQVEKKEGIFRSFCYHRMSLNGQEYDMFPIGFGKEGSKNPVYMGEQQIALVEKDCIVYDDLHHYHITALNENFAIVPILFSCYMYVIAAFKPGVEVEKSISKTVSFTKNKTVLSKYNPDFKNSLER